MSRGFCQEKIFSNQDLVKPSNAAPSTVVGVMAVIRELVKSGLEMKID
jgi:hypothetical protein